METFSWKRLGITIGIVILTAGVVGGTTWYFMDQANKTQKSTINSLQNQVNKLTEDLKEDENNEDTDSSESESADEIANWKTYTNEAWGISFKYPATYNLTENNVKNPGTINAGNLKLSDSSRTGTPAIYLLFNPDGLGGCMLDKNDYSYTAEIKNNKIVILKKERGFAECEYNPRVNTMFDIGHANYQGQFKNGIFVNFIYESGDFQTEIDKIIDTITISKPDIYGSV